MAPLTLCLYFLILAAEGAAVLWTSCQGFVTGTRKSYACSVENIVDTAELIDFLRQILPKQLLTWNMHFIVLSMA